MLQTGHRSVQMVRRYIREGSLFRENSRGSLVYEADEAFVTLDQGAVSNRLEVPMQERSLTIPELVLIAGTRVALGAGLGLLIGDKLSRDVRKGAGWALVGMGVFTTIPLAMGLIRKPPINLRKVA